MDQSKSASDFAPGGAAMPAPDVAVCPFCGHERRITIGHSGACPKCTLEDTAEIRRATSRKIGPWFVLQKKNPTAPGLRFEVLLTLIERGHVMPDSILRGPTTQQLWTPARNVRGVARLWNTCWSCGQAVATTAEICPMCEKSQVPPDDANVYLEGSVQLPVFREIDDSSRPNGLIGSAADGLDGAMADVPAPGVAVRGDRGSSDRPRKISARPKAGNPDALLSPKDLASIFQMELDSKGRLRRKGTTRSVLKYASLFGLVFCLSMTALLALSPKSRELTMRWVGPYWEKAKPYLPEIAVQTSPDLIDPAPASTSQPTSVIDSIDPIATPIAPTPVVPIPEVSTPAPAAIEKAVEPVAVDDTDSQTAEPAITEALPVLSAVADPVEHGRLLRQQALDAEAAGDFAKAVSLYVEIERLPPIARPTDLQVRLSRARTLAEQDKNTDE